MSCFFFFILIISSVASQAYRHLNVKTGASVTIPCAYDMKKYIQHKKYWCSGTHFGTCSIQAYTSQTKGRVTVTDNPTESLFTVTMNNLQTGDTGWYWCVVEIDRGTDISEYLYITVKGDPDLSVKESRVSGEEGGNVTVQCLYREAYQNKQKQWCRFKDTDCYTYKKKTPQNSAVQLSDDGKRSFSVEMRGLNKSDAGWYWCSVEDLQFPVHVNVSDPPPVLTTMTTTTTTITTTTPTTTPTTIPTTELTTAVTTRVPTTSDHDPTIKSNDIGWYLVVLLFLLVILVIIIIIISIMLRLKKSKNQIRTREGSNDTVVHTPTFTAGDPVVYSNLTENPSVTAEDSVIYSSVSKPKSSASKVIEQDVTYSSVNFTSKKKTVSPKDTDETTYSTVVRHKGVCN
ncbi:uncharacterized protein Hap1MRO34_000030 [Clarias gariepinus]